MDLLLYTVAVLLMRALAALPHGAALAFGKAAGALFFHVVRLRRRVVLANLRHVYGGARSEAELVEIARTCYRHWGMTAVEMSRMALLGLEASGASWRVEERFAADLVARHRERSGMIIGVPHIGNFDLAAAGSIALGIEVQIVMKPVHSPRFNRIVVDSRAKSRMTLHFTTEAIYPRLRDLLREGKLLAALPDQNARSKGVDVLFLGKPARLFRGLAKLHLDTGVPLWVGGAIRSREDPRHHDIVGWRLEPPPRTGDAEADLRAVAQTIADGLSALIERAPEQYFWFHRLWGKRVVEVAADAAAPAPAPEAAEV
jgi:KDO2-lipid IV(A) lauroyltransferase